MNRAIPWALAVGLSVASLSGCNRIRHTTELNYPGNGRSTVASIQAEIAKRGYAPDCKEREYCKFRLNEHVWVHFKTDDDEVKLVVDVMNGKEMPPDRVESLRQEGEREGQAIWAVASVDAQQREQAAAVARAEEEERVRAEQERARAEAAANPPAPAAGAFTPQDLQNMMKGMGRPQPVGGPPPGSATSPSAAGSSPRTSSSARCCVNGAFYGCPDMAAVKVCAGDTAACMAGCMNSSDMSCPDKCLQDHPPDPSQCDRDPSRDGECSK